jgi:hypothetical protein
LVAYDDGPARVRGLIGPALRQKAGVVLLCDSASGDLADDVEVQPLSVLGEILAWADYVALDIARENLPGLRERLGSSKPVQAARDTQVLIRTPIPCGGIAECGVCAVTMKSGWKLACKDGPVVDWNELPSPFGGG